MLARQSLSYIGGMGQRPKGEVRKTARICFHRYPNGHTSGFIEDSCFTNAQTVASVYLQCVSTVNASDASAWGNGDTPGSLVGAFH